MTYRIDKAFPSSVEHSPRVLEVAEAFGLGLTDKVFTVYDGLELDIRAGDVVYINGQSGSGKSLLLRELVAQMTAEGLKVADIDRVELQDRPIVDQVGRTVDEALAILSRVGINDAYLVIRKPSELSDGQRYRLKLAKLIESDADVWSADEFGAVLDRTTARVVAFNLQRAAREMGRTLLCATTHTDLKAALGPSLEVVKRFAERVDVRSNPVAPPSQAVIVDIDGTLSDGSWRQHMLEVATDVDKSVGKGRWTEFLAAAKDDPIKLPMVEIVRSLHRQGFRIVLLTGRREDQREMTERWLAQHDIPYDELLMRPADDRREDTVIKLEIYRDQLAQGKTFLCVFEDRARVVKMWREEAGLLCFQICEGNY